MKSNIKFLTQELENEDELTKLILEKSVDILHGMRDHMKDDPSINEVSFILAHLIEYISALIINVNSLETRIEELEEQLLQ